MKCPLGPAKDASCEDRIGSGRPRARTGVIYVDMGYWAMCMVLTHLSRREVVPSLFVSIHPTHTVE